MPLTWLKTFYSFYSNLENSIKNICVQAVMTNEIYSFREIFSFYNDGVQAYKHQENIPESQ